MDRPNVLLVVLDAVRPDHLSTYGYGRKTDPFLSTLAENSLVFENAFANSNWTPTSHAALFTGRLPSETGVYGDTLTIPENYPTIPERLSSAGYRTFGTAAGVHIRSGRGFERGFDAFHETFRIRPSARFLRRALADSEAVKQLVYSLVRGHDNYTYYKTERLKRWIGTDPGDDPFFAFVNFKTAHHPYDPPRPYKSLFSDVDRPPIDVIELLAEKLGREPQSLPEGDIDRVRRISQEYPLIADTIDPTDEELATVKAWYDGAIRYMDDRVADIVGHLREHGLLENTCVVVTADHGEQFGDHGLGKHRYSLYDELLRVPLVVRLPERTDIQASAEGQSKDGTPVGKSVTRRSEMVSLIDLFPTIVNLAKAEFECPRFAEDLFSATDHEYLFAEVGRKPASPVRRHHTEFTDTPQNGPLQSVRDDSWKLIRRADDTQELYNWREDTDETTDLAATSSEVDRLASVLESSVTPLGDRIYDETVSDERLQRQLEDMGYL
ncbi:sulfatase [Halosimplex rubrum]|nr:sulfatase [Halosimplex rubrum]